MTPGLVALVAGHALLESFYSTRLSPLTRGSVSSRCCLHSLNATKTPTPGTFSIWQSQIRTTHFPLQLCTCNSIFYDLAHYF